MQSFFLFQRVPGSNSVADLSFKIVFQTHKFAVGLIELETASPRTHKPKIESLNMYKKYNENPTEIQSCIKNRCYLGSHAKIIFNEIQALYGDHVI